MNLLERIKKETIEAHIESLGAERGGQEFDADYLTEDIVYRALAEAEDLADEEIRREEKGGALVDVTHGHTLFKAGAKLYFVYVSQGRLVRDFTCTNSNRVWANASFSFTGNQCANAGKLVYSIYR